MHSESNFTHFNSQGNAHMVDVAHKATTHRKAVAQGSIRMHPHTLQKIAEGGHKKGDVLGIARIAAIMAAKKTADLIPLCHPIALTHVDCTFHLDTEQSMVHCLVTAETVSQTGVEMEALTSVQVALLTIYDMCKAIDRGMTMENIRLLEKTGGSSGTWVANV